VHEINSLFSPLPLLPADCAVAADAALSEGGAVSLGEICSFATRSSNRRDVQIAAAFVAGVKSYLPSLLKQNGEKNI